MNLLYSVSFVITVLGGIFWGLIGAGGFIGKNLNLIAFLSRGNSLIEYCTYLFIGICALFYVWISSKK